MSCPPNCPECSGRGFVEVIDFTGVTAEPCNFEADHQFTRDRLVDFVWEESQPTRTDKLQLLGVLLFVAIIAACFVYVVTS